MSEYLSKSCTAFAGTGKLVCGPLVDVALAVRGAVRSDTGGGAVLVFDDATGAVVDLDLRGSTAAIIERLTSQGEAAAFAAAVRARPGGGEAQGRGRPKLGVTAREVTLLPRHWEWLAQQQGGASQTLRRLIDQARKADDGLAEVHAARERCYRFLTALAGDLPGYEEVIRALFAGDDATFSGKMAEWPSDVRGYALQLLRAG
ncbi:DUF2239 family protein [Acetobacter sp. AN02]|uniref:DUF2239 family protein n=1 Tax=Acetobacter sp. AN02 TaxID=2894186 RepID=UPI0024345BC7|nr:DUF2239 family protein [Acetobacter sp. AN02]MDG6094942.1 DUF2239 family protein [Acetobacter sp. AN02]